VLDEEVISATSARKYRYHYPDLLLGALIEIQPASRSDRGVPLPRGRAAERCAARTAADPDAAPETNPGGRTALDALGVALLGMCLWRRPVGYSWFEHAGGQASHGTERADRQCRPIDHELPPVENPLREGLAQIIG
jgi:hypothetical protein